MRKNKRRDMRERLEANVKVSLEIKKEGPTTNIN